MSAFALGYFGAPGLPAALVEVPIESLQQGIELFRERFADGRAVGLVGFSKGAELALLLAAQMGGAIGRVVAVAPSHVVWFDSSRRDLTWIAVPPSPAGVCTEPRCPSYPARPTFCLCSPREVFAPTPSWTCPDTSRWMLTQRGSQSSGRQARSYCCPVTTIISGPPRRWPRRSCDAWRTTGGATM